VKRVNLIQYPKFWIDMTARINKHIDPSAAVGSHHIKLWMQRWYGINVYVMPTNQLGEVYMLDEDYTMFVLRWS
jgi:hypothetical protein